MAACCEGGFAGLRSAEIERLDWAKVDLENGYVTVDASIAKTNSRRLVPIVPNLKPFLNSSEACREDFSRVSQDFRMSRRRDFEM